MNILIVDGYSAAHVGNGVLYESSVYYLKKTFPNSNINVLAINKPSLDKIKAECVDKHEVCFIKDIPVGGGVRQKLGWISDSLKFILPQYINCITSKQNIVDLARDEDEKRALKMLDEADMVVSITGEQLNDAFRKTIPAFVFIHWLAIKQGKKMVYFPQSIGPLNKKWTKKMVGNVLKKSHLVVARDQFSKDELEKLEIPKSKTLYTPDIGVIQPYLDKDKSLEYLKELGIKKDRKLLVGFTISKIHFIEDGVESKDYIEIMINSIKKSMNPESVEILLMPANYPLDGSVSTDYYICEDFKQKLEDNGYCVKILEKKIYSPFEFKGYQSCLDIFITTRMHAAILGTMAKAPTITINTQRKLKGYMDNIEMGEFSIDLRDLNEDLLVDKINNIVDNRALIKLQLEHQEKKMEVWLDDLGKTLKSGVNND